jgi:nitrite reductase (NO-forming)
MTLDRTGPTGLRDRTRWHLGANAPVVVWLTASVAVALVGRSAAQSRWLMVHLLLLGAVTNAIFVWSSHFADALLRRRATAGSRRWQATRMVALNLGVITVVAGMVSATWLLIMVGSLFVGTAAAAHGITIAMQARSALPSRFGATVRYYIYASIALPVGAGLGATLAKGLTEPWHARLLVAHLSVNVLGWIGLTVMGTLVTLWPTMLRTRIAEGAERVARQALPILAGSLVVLVIGALLGLQSLAAVGAAAYLGAVLWAARPMAKVTRAKTPSAYATWSVMAAVIWLAGSLLAMVAVLVVSPGWPQVSQGLRPLVLPLAAGFAGQIVLGAMSFLVPVVLGGGPNILRGTQSRMDRGSGLRACLINAGLLVAVLPLPNQVRLLVSVLVLCGFASFLPLLAAAVLYAVRARRVRLERASAPVEIPAHTAEPTALVHGRQRRQALVALLLVVLAVAVGFVMAALQ